MTKIEFPLSVLFIALFITLGGCSALQVNTEPSANTEPAKTNTQKLAPSKNKLLKISPPCVYESTKGVAEVIELNPQQVTFKFYPGDQIFSLPAKVVEHSDISLEQELKAIIRTPLSGPCKETEFELLSTIE
jgi:hypothetical protein